MDFHVADLCELIEEVREELIKLGMIKPFTDPAVIKLSQRLDSLLNEYEYLKQQIYLNRQYKGA